MAEDEIFRTIPFGWRTETVFDQSPEIFAWLGMLDLNVEVIIILMVLISIINMTSALLIIILERRAMVGMLKALGMRDGVVVRMFLLHGARIIGRGFVWGNILGGGLAWMQHRFEIIGLDPTAYYVDHVPINVDFSTLAIVELVAFVGCAGMMVVPAWFSARIRPAMALRMR
jgi:lipoprotein-releasing system permease protein